MTAKGNEIVIQRHATVLQHYDPERTNIQVLDQSVQWPVRIGVFLICVFLFGFGVWAAVVPLAGGAVAPGIISPDGSKRTVQHLEGGIIRALHVRDGDVVEKGQALLVLESIQPKANHDLLLKQQATLRIAEFRLGAERENALQVEFPPELLNGGPEASAAISVQRELFQARQETHRAKERILRQRVGQLKEQIKGYEAQVASTTRQLELISEELQGKRELERKGYLPKPELLRMLRMEAEIGGRRGQFQASISQAQQQIGEAELQLVANQAERANQIATQLDETRTELGSLKEKLRASKDILNRTVIEAPVSGTVVDLQFKTISGVVQPGVPILDIVPAEEKLMIDAHVSPMDIDVVHAGLKAQVQLSAFSTRSTPRVDGVVRSVSADRLMDEATSQPYFLARVEVAREELLGIGPDIELVPGMPADVLIVTGERTLAKYLLQPFMDAIWKTFREV
ncbi:MAG: HlyD family type I secretion periplasmic adaptor subunit [Hyphomicrobiaceae bacterium]